MNEVAEQELVSQMNPQMGQMNNMQQINPNNPYMIPPQQMNMPMPPQMIPNMPPHPHAPPQNPHQPNAFYNPASGYGIQAPASTYDQPVQKMEEGKKVPEKDKSMLEKYQTMTSESPYLSPNKVHSSGHTSNYYVPNESNLPLNAQHSPYLMNNATGFSGDYLSVPHHKEQVHHVNYRGHYSNIAKEVRKDG
jgi:hypothetical protein